LWLAALPSPPDLPLPNRQANQAGFYGNGDIWSVGGIDGATFQFLNEVWHRNNGGCPHSDTNRDSNSYAYSDRNADGYSYGNGNGNNHTTPDADCNADTLGDPASPDAKAAAHAVPSADAVRMVKE
jgi:hypothetical protein